MRDKTHVDNLDIKRNGRLGWKPSTIFVSLDFIKCVQIFLSSKKGNLCRNMSRFFRHQRKSLR